MPLVSIIVPVYNAQSYLDACVNSILKQTFVDFELILINDGSTDNSDLLCMAWCKKDIRIKSYYQKNKGVTQARAYGVGCSIGQWIMFVDADDILPSNALEHLLMHSAEGDIIIGKIQSFSKDKSYSLKDEQSVSRVLNSIDFISYLLDNSIPLLSSPCARIYKRMLFDSETFNLPRSIVRGEDYIMNMRVAVKVHNVCLINDIVYLYRQHAVSAIHTFHSSWAYEKEFLSYLLQPLYEKELFNHLARPIIQCKLRSMGNAYHDKVLNFRNSDFIQYKKTAQSINIGFLEKCTLALIYFPPSIRRLTYRVIRRLLCTFC